MTFLVAESRATSRGFFPSLLGISGRAPPAMRTWTVGTKPALAAMCNEVFPSLSAALASTPHLLIGIGVYQQHAKLITTGKRESQKSLSETRKVFESKKYSKLLTIWLSSWICEMDLYLLQQLFYHPGIAIGGGSVDSLCACAICCRQIGFFINKLVYYIQHPPV